MTNQNQQNPNQGGQKNPNDQKGGQGHGSEHGGQQQQQGGQKASRAVRRPTSRASAPTRVAACEPSQRRHTRRARLTHHRWI